MKTVTFGGEKEILHNLPYEAISVTVKADTAGTVTENGRKILKAGTVVEGVGGSVFDDRTKKVQKAAGTTADGIIQHDVDVTDGDAEVSMVYAGTVRSDRVAGYSNTVKAALPRIQFVKGV